MGRFDSRIRFWDGSSWISPARLQIRNAANTDWIDYGTNTSYINRELYVRDAANTAWIRVTRNRQDVWNYNYVWGNWMNIAQGNQFNCYSTSASVYFRIKIEIQRYATGAMIICTNNQSGTAGWEFGINASNQIYLTTKYNSTSATKVYTGYTVPTGAWTTIEIYGFNNNTTLYLKINNGTAWTMTGSAQRSQSSATRAIYWNANMHFRGQILVQGTNGSSSTTQQSMDVWINNAAVGATLNLSNGSGTITSGAVVEANYTETYV